jgi:hypothetical protein
LSVVTVRCPIEHAGLEILKSVYGVLLDVAKGMCGRKLEAC